MWGAPQPSSPNRIVDAVASTAQAAHSSQACTILPELGRRDPSALIAWLSVVAGDTSRVAPAVLVARLGKGTIVYSALTLGDQLAAATPGAARLLADLLSIGLAPTAR